MVDASRAGDRTLTPSYLRYTQCPMAKNCRLQVSADEGRNLVTFTVQAPPSRFFTYVRVPFVAVLVAYAVPLAYRLVHDAPLTAVLNRQWALLVVVLVAAVALLLLQPQCDSLIVMEDMGVQLSSRRRWRFLRGDSTEFIPCSDIIDIVVHEAFHGYGQVIFYMCILTKAQGGGGGVGDGSSAVKVVFPNFLPRKDMLLQVWRQSRSMLYGSTRRSYRR